MFCEFIQDNSSLKLNGYSKDFFFLFLNKIIRCNSTKVVFFFFSNDQCMFEIKISCLVENLTFV